MGFTQLSYDTKTVQNHTPVNKANSEQSTEEAEFVLSDDLVTQLQSGTSDPGLLLYRSGMAKQKVIDFYTNLTSSQEVAMAILTAAGKQNIPLSLAFALAWTESDFVPNAENRNKNSVDKGLFQLNSLSFPHLKEKDFLDPQINASYGLHYLRFCLDRGGNEVVALAMYNAGRIRVENSGAPRITLDYISRILDYRDLIDNLFAKEFLKPVKIVQRKNSKDML